MQEIFIPYEKSESDLKYEKTMEKADQIRQKALDGEDFWELVTTYGQDEKMLEAPD
ncbi:MAG: peptidylprolyl isomerase, partial [Clostridia bacterium]|nr:peptidylprolyl isomerase [Clostridia bacterium]